MLARATCRQWQCAQRPHHRWHREIFAGQCREAARAPCTAGSRSLTQAAAGQRSGSLGLPYHIPGKPAVLASLAAALFLSPLPPLSPLLYRIARVRLSIALHRAVAIIYFVAGCCVPVSVFSSVDIGWPTLSSAAFRRAFAGAYRHSPFLAPCVPHWHSRDFKLPQTPRLVMRTRRRPPPRQGRAPSVSSWRGHTRADPASTATQ
jgi:hypothetical protein